MLTSFGIQEYTNKLKEDHNVLQNIFESRKYDKKKISKNISTSLTPLDMRLLMVEGFDRTYLEVEDQEMLLDCINLSTNYNHFIQFDSTKIVEPVMNYSLAIFPIREILNCIVSNKFGFPNIIYLPLPQNVEGDPYSFYYLLEETTTSRNWKMDCRLEDISMEISAHLLRQCRDLFRAIYCAVFGDNDYRKDFASHGQITESECKQLIQNTKDLSSTMSFCKMLQEVVMRNSTWKPTEKDKFNLYGDDKLQQRRFKNEEGREEETSTVEGYLRSLFDIIEDCEVREL